MAPPLLASGDTMEDLDFLHQPDTEPIPGYRLLAPLGRGGFGEVWKAEAPGGLLKAIKFVQGDHHALDPVAAADEELRAIQRVRTVRHPFILSMERVEVVVGELVIVCELADRSLADVLAAERRAGRPGIPRDALLAYLREAAEALDVMHVRHGLQHLDVKPQNLFLVANHVKVGDFGLVQSLSGSSGGNISLGAITPLYASPEVFQGRISQHSDQYSLAIVYQELLTGTLPFNGKNARQLLMQHIQAPPDLEALPEADRQIVGRALAKDPAARYPSCSDFVLALATGQCEAATVVELPLKPSPSAVDTRRTPAARTVRTRSLASVRPPALSREQPLQFVDLLSRTPLTEVWDAKRPDGRPCVVKVLFACGVPDANLSRLNVIRHPALLPAEVLYAAPGKVVLAMPTGDRTLKDAAAEHQAGGRPGVPRVLLLSWLAGVADALDTLAGELGLAHLGLNPRALLLDRDELKVADFGVAHLVWQPAGQALPALNTRYSAPELASPRQAGPACDQYSLALIYHEMLTGGLPPAGPRGEFDLDRLPAPDRPIVARALSVDPKDRWPCSGDLIRALVQVGGEAVAAEAGLAQTAPIRRAPTVPMTPGDVLQMRFGTNLAADAIRHRIESFAKQWQARVLKSDGHSFTYHLPTPRSFWQRWTGRQPAVEVALIVGEPEVHAPAGVQVRTEVRLDVRPRDCPEGEGKDLLGAVGPLLVESLRQHLQTASRGRQHERVIWPYPLQMSAVLPDGTSGPAVECQGKDISLSGIGFYIPGQLPSSHVLLALPRTAQTARATVPARVVRVQGCGDGWYEVGAVLLPPDELPPDDEG